MVEMKKESIIVLALLALMISGCSPYSGKTPADTVVSPLGDKISVTEGCLVYALPMTVFELDIIAEKRTEVPGPYARYASELTGLDNVITGHTEKWSLAGIRLSAVEELDPSQFYIIQGTAMMQTNICWLSEKAVWYLTSTLTCTAVPRIRTCKVILIMQECSSLTGEPMSML